MKNPFNLLAASVQSKIKAAFVAMQTKFKSDSDLLTIELVSKNTDLKRVKEKLKVSDEDRASLHEQLDAVNSKLVELKKSWNFLQSTSANAAKVQKLIESYKKIKIELLELRKKCDCSVNDFESLQQDNSRMRILIENLSVDGKVDVNILLENIANLKKENSQYKTRCENLERLVKNIKKNEEKLVNAIKARQVL